VGWLSRLLGPRDDDRTPPDRGITLEPIPFAACAVHDWSYVPAGPFIVQWHPDRLTLEGILVEEWQTLEGAVRRMIAYNTPMRHDHHGEVIDSTGRRVLFWVTSGPSREMNPFGWMGGVKACFDILADGELVDEVARMQWAWHAEEDGT
jgi:hypothetical protein